MLTATQIGGFAGAGLAGAAYLPQIWHLVGARCSAGISRLAFGVWLVASVLVTARAVAIGADVFIALGGIQIVATAVIVACAARYRDTPCPVHLPGQPAARTAAGTGSPGDEPSSRRPAGRLLPQRHRPGTAGHGAGTSRSCAGMAMRSPNLKPRTWGGRHECISRRCRHGG